MPQIKYKLPPLYQNFFPDFMELEHPTEKWATCSSCVRCRSEKSPHIGSKCCEYYPYLANYLVGGILQDKRPEMAEGQRRVRAVMQRQEGVTPYGILPTKEHKTLLKNGFDEFGNHVDTSLEAMRELSVAMRCPYLHEGDCTVWDYRENLCSTHFCISTGGPKGFKFWKTTNNYLQMAESALSCYVLHQLGFPPSQNQATLLESLKYDLLNEQGQIDREGYQKMWLDWEGREEELYVRSYEIVATLNQEQFVAICGHNQVILQEAIRDTLTTFHENITPEYLYLSPEIIRVPGESPEFTLRLGAEEATMDPITYTLLKKFDGHTATTEIMNLGIKVMLPIANTINELYQKKMLIPAPVGAAMRP